MACQSIREKQLLFLLSTILHYWVFIACHFDLGKTTCHQVSPFFLVSVYSMNIISDMGLVSNIYESFIFPSRFWTLVSNSHLNGVVRKCTAQHLTVLVEKIGTGRLLSGAKDLTDRILPAVSKLAQDSSQETRFALYNIYLSVC